MTEQTTVANAPAIFPNGAPPSEDEVLSQMTDFFATTEGNKPAAVAPPSAVDPGVEQPEEDAQPEQADEPAADDDPEEELEHLGKSYKVPASLKRAFEENRSGFGKYGQERAALEAARAQLALQAQRAEAEGMFQKYASPEIQAEAEAKAALSQWRKLDRSQYDAEQRAQIRDKIEELEYKLDEATEALSKKRGEYDQWKKQTDSEILRQGKEFLTRMIPGFEREDVRAGIAKSALSHGYTQEELQAGLTDPRLVLVLHKAAKWDALQASKPAAANKVAKAPPVTKPGASTTQNAQQSAQLRDLEGRFMKSGSIEDGAALLLARQRAAARRI